MPVGHRVARESRDTEALLVIGVHREELAFGERVAAVLAEREDLAGLKLLRIPEGISGQHPRSDQRFHYELLHRAIYRQIQETAGRYRLLIDLHGGEDDEGLCADVICGNPQLLQCVRQQVVTGSCRDFSSHAHRVRTVQLTRDSLAVAQGATAARTVIPPEVWDSPDFLFVGLEVYLPTQGAGRQQDWAFAAGWVKQIIHCARRLDRGAHVGA
jgi:hypothetical protein